jgi:hypothetical protein
VILATAGRWVGWVQSLTQLQLGFVVLVAASSGFLAVQGGATPGQFLVAVCSGTVLGLGLVGYLQWIAPESGGWQ